MLTRGVVALFLWPIVALAGPIYVYKESDGAIRFTDRPPPEGVKSEVFTAKGGGSYAKYSLGPIRRRSGKLMPDRYLEVIKEAAILNNLEIPLIQAVIHAESAFDPWAVSPKGAQGLMQLMPATARFLKVRNSFNPEENINGGTRYLAFLMKRFSGNLKMAIAGYNAGPEAVEQYGGIPPYPETRDYVQRVLHLRERYALRKSTR